nr:hypothetical protein [Tanacetum cinerariifolium]
METNLIDEILVGFQVQAFQLFTLIIYDNRFGVDRGRLSAASVDRVFGPRFNRGGIKNGGGCDMPNMCGSVHGRSGSFRIGRGEIGERGHGRGRKCGVDKSADLTIT